MKDFLTENFWVDIGLFVVFLVCFFINKYLLYGTIKSYHEEKTNLSYVFLIISLPAIFLLLTIFSGTDDFEISVSYYSMIITQILFNINYFYSRSYKIKKVVQNDNLVKSIYANKYDILKMIENKLQMDGLIKNSYEINKIAEKSKLVELYSIINLNSADDHLIDVPEKRPFQEL